MGWGIISLVFHSKDISITSIPDIRLGIYNHLKFFNLPVGGGGGK